MLSYREMVQAAESSSDPVACIPVVTEDGVRVIGKYVRWVRPPNEPPEVTAIIACALAHGDIRKGVFK